MASLSPSRSAPQLETAGATRAREGRFGVGLAVMVIVFAVVRLAGMGGDLWLDEIWSLRMVEPLKSAVEIFTKVQHDNNHPLNSLWLYLVQPAKAEWVYRLLSWGMGSAAVALAGLIGRRQFRRMSGGEDSGRAAVAGWVAATLVGGAYLLIHYSSEARGYAPAVALGLLAFYALLHATDREWVRWAVVYGLACGLGLLAHVAVVQVMIAGLAWAVVELGRDGRSWRERVGRAAAWQAGPWVFAAVYYFGFVRHLKIGGGPENPLIGVLGETAAFTLGLPVSVGVAVALPVLLGAVVAGMALVGRRDRGLAVFYVTLVFIAPALGLVFSRFALLFPRYFIFSAAGGLLLVGYGLAWWWARGGAWREAVLGLLVLFLAGNGVHVARLWQEGRGQYQAAVRYIAAQTPTAVITAAGDHDFRNFTVLSHYQGVAGAERSLRYYPGERIPARGVQWLFLHRLDGEVAPGGVIEDVRGNRYRLDRVFRHAALSGWDWWVYRSERLLAAP